MALLITILRIIVFIIVIKLIWGIVSSIMLPDNSNSRVKGKSRKQPSIWDRIDRDKVEDADYKEID